MFWVQYYVSVDDVMGIYGLGYIIRTGIPNEYLMDRWIRPKSIHLKNADSKSQKLDLYFLMEYVMTKFVFQMMFWTAF